MTALSIAEVLDRAADLIEPEGAWTQGAYARGPSGRMTFTADPAATCFCLRGALVRVGAVDAWSEDSPATRALGFATAKRMTYWNDNKRRTQAQVLHRLRTAAACARAAA